MKKLSYIICRSLFGAARRLSLSAVLVCAALLSCTIDAYDKGEGEYSQMTAELVMAHVNADKHIDGVDTDQGEHLAIGQPVAVKWMNRPDTTYRVLLYYNRSEDGKAEPISVNRVGVMQPMPADSLKNGVKDDPLHFDCAWLSKNRKWLNLRLRLLTGSTDDEKAIHTIGAVADSTSTPTHIRLLLYHHQGGVPEYYSVTTYASIPLENIRTDSLTLIVNTYDGTLSRTFTHLHATE
jgi:hypothetical protein